VKQHGPRPRVLEDVGDLGRLEPIADLHVLPAHGLQRRVELDVLVAVVQERRDALARPDAERVQPVRQLR
jgi:hypothetical protein